jgi:hypothetical protein
MRGSSRFAVLLALGVAVAACDSTSEPVGGGTLGPTSSATATASPTATTTSEPATATPATPTTPSTAEEGTGEVLVTTQSFVSCPQIGPSPKSDCGFRPLPKVPIEVSHGGDTVITRTGDDGTELVQVPAGAVTVTGADVAELPWTPEPIEIEVSAGAMEAVLLIYSAGPQIPPPPR